LGVGFDGGRRRMRNTVHLIIYTDKQHIRIRIGVIYLGEITERFKESPFLFQKIKIFVLLNFQKQLLLKILNISHTLSLKTYKNCLQ
jgi:hypothetical protein